MHHAGLWCVQREGRETIVAKQNETDVKLKARALDCQRLFLKEKEGKQNRGVDCHWMPHSHAWHSKHKLVGDAELEIPLQFGRSLSGDLLMALVTILETVSKGAAICLLLSIDSNTHRPFAPSQLHA
jgi:hypothetical protein